MMSTHQQLFRTSYISLAAFLLFSACNAKTVGVKKRAQSEAESIDNPIDPEGKKKTTGGSTNTPTPVRPEAVKENQLVISPYINASNVSSFPISGPCQAGEKIIIEAKVGTKSQKTETNCDNTLEFSVDLDFSTFPGSEAMITITVHGTNGLDSEPLELSIAIDLVAPTVSITSPAANAATTFQATLEGPCSDEGGTITISAAGIPRQTTTCVSGQFSIEAVVPGPNGASTLTVTHSDAAGNEISTVITLQRTYSFLDGNGDQDFPFKIL